MKEEEFYEEIVPAKCIADAPDWEKFRREAAKDILCAILHGRDGVNPKHISMAIEIADELIKRLWEGRK